MMWRARASRPETPQKLKYHLFQNHYTHKTIIFKLFRLLQLQFSGPTGINFRYSYSFVGLTGICLYSYSSVQLHKKWSSELFSKKLQLLRERFCESGEGVSLPRERSGNFRGSLERFPGSLGNFRGTSGLLLSSTVRELPGKSPKNFRGSSGNFRGSPGTSQKLGGA